ncbi:MAG: trypsin-like peptidase domain-containing protein [Chloroflexi bacterium]|nr:trypsin-like peptidase domain-containing protein [Chloroflexota bacterium]
MRQNRTFPPVNRQPEPEPPPLPSRVNVLRHRIGCFYTRFHKGFLASAVILIALATMLVYDSTKPPPQRLTQRDINAAVERALAAARPKPSYASEAYQIIRPSVVHVSALLSETEGKNNTAIGAGVVIDDTGTILTSLHIVKDAVRVRVVFADGTESEAAIVLRQPENDLAVLRPSVIPDDLLPATLGSSEGLRVGDEVVAVGDPFGITDSVSAGVVSGLGRNFKSPKTGDMLRNLIQFDAAVNPGNSGGPLVNRNGEVLGIVTALLNPTEQEVFIGIGFAVTIETAGGAAGAPPI